jgi:hypothetical protein
VNARGRSARCSAAASTCKAEESNTPNRTNSTHMHLKLPPPLSRPLANLDIIILDQCLTLLLHCSAESTGGQARTVRLLIELLRIRPANRRGPIFVVAAAGRPDVRPVLPSTGSSLKTPQIAMVNVQSEALIKVSETVDHVAQEVQLCHCQCSDSLKI